MGRLIDADALIHELNNSHYPGAPYVDAGISIAIGKVCDAPTIAPVRNGKWIKTMEGNAFRDKCSECESLYPNAFGYNWCPNCGVKMEEPEDIPIEYFESGGR